MLPLDRSAASHRTAKGRAASQRDRPVSEKGGNSSLGGTDLELPAGQVGVQRSPVPYGHAQQPQCGLHEQDARQSVAHRLAMRQMDN